MADHIRIQEVHSFGPQLAAAGGFMSTCTIDRAQSDMKPHTLKFRAEVLYRIDRVAHGELCTYSYCRQLGPREPEHDPHPHISPVHSKVEVEVEVEVEY